MSDELAGSPIAYDLRPWVARTVRIGYAAKGVIYLLIGTLAFRLAAGLDGGRLLDASGALRIILRQPFGVLLLGILAIGILAYAAWQCIEGVWDTRGKGGLARLGQARAHDYQGRGVRSRRMARSAHAGRGTRFAEPRCSRGRRDQRPARGYVPAARRVGGRVYGFFEIRDAWHARFGDDLDSYRLRREAGRWAIYAGRFGNGARGVILTTMGLALVTAAVRRDPSEAGHTGDTFRTLFAQPFGWALPAKIAAGLVCFGVFQLLHARYARL